MIQNAKWLQHFFIFLQTDNALKTADQIILCKIKYQEKVLRFVCKHSHNVCNEKKFCEQISHLFLKEARFSKIYWSILKNDFKNKINFDSRKPRFPDAGNRLLDIGYHYLSSVFVKHMEALSLPYDIGLLHKAKSKNSKPLVYDLIEPFRPFLIDRTWIKFINKKKKKIEVINTKDIARFIYLIKEEQNKLYYHNKLKRCITLDYWIYLYLQSFYSSVIKNEVFYPYLPSLRNEDRCKKGNLNKMTQGYI